METHEIIELSNAEISQERACSRPCIDKTAAATGKTGLVLPI